MSDLTLIGHAPSVYTRSVRMALHAKSVQSRPALARWCAALTAMDAFASTRPDIVHQIEKDI